MSHFVVKRACETCEWAAPSDDPGWIECRALPAHLAPSSRCGAYRLDYFCRLWREVPRKRNTESYDLQLDKAKKGVLA